jgi:hypothetical protein
MSFFICTFSTRVGLQFSCLRSSRGVGFFNQDRPDNPKASYLINFARTKFGFLPVASGEASLVLSFRRRPRRHTIGEQTLSTSSTKIPHISDSFSFHCYRRGITANAASGSITRIIASGRDLHLLPEVRWKIVKTRQNRTGGKF